MVTLLSPHLHKSFANMELGFYIEHVCISQLLSWLTIVMQLWMCNLKTFKYFLLQR